MHLPSECNQIKLKIIHKKQTIPSNVLKNNVFTGCLLKALTEPLFYHWNNIIVIPARRHIQGRCKSRNLHTNASWSILIYKCIIIKELNISNAELDRTNHRAATVSRDCILQKHIAWISLIWFHITSIYFWCMEVICCTVHAFPHSN